MEWIKLNDSFTQTGCQSGNSQKAMKSYTSLFNSCPFSGAKKGLQLQAFFIFMLFSSWRITPQVLVLTPNVEASDEEAGACGEQAVILKSSVLYAAAPVG
ncbi:hypothetical protein [Filimonas lacunae]|uniref:hypothetical protein n=1 Tax=Filimonas lacunae TaxID=477680 RepID=UPI001186421E|nr:hypothetical protein [Filimonas lacunae]